MFIFLLTPPWRFTTKVSFPSLRFPPASWHTLQGCSCNLLPIQQSYCPSTLALSKLIFIQLGSNLCFESHQFVPQCRVRRRTALQKVECWLTLVWVTFLLKRHASIQYSRDFLSYFCRTLLSCQCPAQRRIRLQHRHWLGRQYWRTGLIRGFQWERCVQRGWVVVRRQNVC